MKKLICITTALILVFSSFALAFADSTTYTATYGQNQNSFEYFEYVDEENGVYLDLSFFDSFELDLYEENGSLYAADYIFSRLAVSGGAGSHFSVHVQPNVMQDFYEDGEFSQDLFEESFTCNDFFQECGRMTYDPDTGLLEVFFDTYSEDFGDLIQDVKLYAADVDDPYYGDFIPLDVMFCFDDPEAEAVEMNLDPIVAQFDPYLRDFAKICASYTFEHEEGVGRVTSFDITKPDTLEKPAVFNTFITSLGYDPIEDLDPEPQTNIGLSGIISSISAVFTSAIGWVSTTVQTIMSTPLLLIFAIIPLIYLGVTMTRRLLNL